MPTSDFLRRLDELATGYQHAQILFTGLRAGLFDRLRAPASAAGIAGQLQWNPRATRMLLDALVALQLVEKEHDAYCNAPIAEACLVAGAPADQTSILRHKANAWDTWSRLEEAVRSGAPIARNEPSPDDLRAFICGMGDIARQSAQTILQAVDLAPYKHLLDIGGGPGAYSIAFLNAHPHMRATIVDLPQVLPIAEQQARDAGLEERIAFQAGDLTSDPFRHGVDLILVSNIVHSYSYEQNRDLVKRCYEALARNGMLIIKDFFVEPDRSGPAYSLVFALHMLLHTQAGDAYTTHEVAEWTTEAGFPPGKLVDLTPQSRLWLVSKE